jgi:hypothetical protein
MVYLKAFNFMIQESNDAKREGLFKIAKQHNKKSLR